MSFASRMKTLYRLVAAPVTGDTHADRIESFYGKQAADYDDTRSRMLHGREDLISKVPLPPSGIWIEFGSGTGSNAELLGDKISQLQSVHLVDLSPSLMDIAKARIERHGWSNVQTHLDDATRFRLPQPADVVLFSYSLTMIPNWFAAIDNAIENLKPGGVIAVVDYYVSRNHPGESMVRHSWSFRTYAPTLFSRNNVHPNPDHIYYLQHHFDQVLLEERMGQVCGRWLSAPYYLFLGRKKI